MKRLFYILLVLFAIVPLPKIVGQDIGNLLYSNYEGLSAILKNPAGGVDNRIYMDINLVTGSGMEENNFFYIPRQDFRASDFLLNPSAIPRYEKHPLFTKGLPFKNYSGVQNPFIKLEGTLTGPSILISKKTESFGFYTRMRVWGKSTIPEAFLMFMLNGPADKRLYGSENTLPDFTAGYMMWGETGFHYARLLNPGYNDNWYLGANVKFLTGFQAAHLCSDQITYSLDDNSVMTLNGLNMHYAYTDGPDFLHPNGFGGATDIGVTFVKRGKTRPTDTYLSLREQSSGEYRYKAGISITDLGAIRYVKTITEIHIASDQEVVIQDINKKEFTSLDSVNLILAQAVYGSSIPESLKTDHFTIPLSPTVSAQFDYHLTKGFYINGSVDLPFSFSEDFMRAPIRTLICPRYESANLSIWLPVSYNLTSGLHAGFAVRFGWITLGTEILGQAFSSSDFTGLNGYFSFHIPLVKIT